MKILLCGLLATFFLAVQLRAQDTVQAAAQREAIAKLPGIAQAGSSANKMFLAEVERARREEPSLFSKSDWPVVVATRIVESVQRVICLGASGALVGVRLENGEYVEVAGLPVIGQGATIEAMLLPTGKASPSGSPLYNGIHVRTLTEKDLAPAPPTSRSRSRGGG